MQLPIRLGNRIRAQKSILACLREAIGSALLEALTVDSTINHDMRDMHSLRAILPGGALGHGT